jgi:hypothetical protein
MIVKQKKNYKKVTMGSEKKKINNK